jgi:hypothetical protein
MDLQKILSLLQEYITVGMRTTAGPVQPALCRPFASPVRKGTIRGAAAFILVVNGLVNSRAAIPKYVRDPLSRK